MSTDGSPAVEIGPEGWPDVSSTLLPDWVAWCSTYLTQPDGPNAGDPWRFTRQQLRYLAHWATVNPDGTWKYRRGTIRLMKGAGKDPIAAVLALLALLGPSEFGGWRSDGTPFGVPHPAPWVQVAAVAREQTRTTMRLFKGLISKRCAEEYGLEVHKEIIYTSSGACIEALTSSPDSAEGPRPNLVIRNEIQNWVKANQGHDMDEALRGNLAKSRDGVGRTLSFCNAHVPGRDSVGEREWDAYRAVSQGRTQLQDILYFAVEAPPDTVLKDPDSLRHGLLVARGDSTWLNVDRIMADIYDPQTSPSEARRKYLNQIVAAEDAWVNPQQWATMKEQDLTFAEGELVTLGLDPSRTRDHTALVATRISDGAWLTLGVWVPQPDTGEVRRDLIDAEVRAAFQRFDVVGFFSDVHPFESYIDAWMDELGQDLCVRATPKHPIGWDMRARQREFTVDGAQRVRQEIVEGSFRHDGHPMVAEHVGNTKQRPNAWGITVGKESRESERKIDAVPAGILSRMARRAYLALPASKQRRKRTNRASFF